METQHTLQLCLMIHIATWTYGATNQTQTTNQNISPPTALTATTASTAATAAMALTNPLAHDSVNATNGSSISPAYLINSTSMPVQSLPATGTISSEPGTLTLASTLSPTFSSASVSRLTPSVSAVATPAGTVNSAAASTSAVGSLTITGSNTSEGTTSPSGSNTSVRSITLAGSSAPSSTANTSLIKLAESSTLSATTSASPVSIAIAGSSIPSTATNTSSGFISLAGSRATSATTNASAQANTPAVALVTPGQSAIPPSPSTNLDDKFGVSVRGKIHVQLYSENSARNHGTNKSSVLENPFGCECGGGEFGLKTINAHFKQRQGLITNRIVNGYESKRKPWMLFLYVLSKKDKSLAATCGASILNMRWGITAAHCLCHHADSGIELPCEVIDGKTVAMYKPYDPKMTFEIFVYYGIQSTQVINAGTDPDLQKFRVSLKKVIINPGFTLHTANEEVHSDIALFQTRLKFRFSEFVSSVCLPGPEFIDKELRTYIVGFGNQNSKGVGQDESCTTSGEGPDPFKSCRMYTDIQVPYMYENGVVPPTFMGCTYLPTPQSFNPVCNVNKMRGLNLPFNGFIVYNENGTNTTCYRDMPVAENHGWCAVCSVHNGESDDENSCEYEGVHTPDLDKGWGFCSDSCTFPDEELLGTSLQETSVSVFSNEQCYSLNNNTWTFNPKLELCGSHIWRRKGVYMKRNHEKDAEKEYETTPIVEELIGAADACQGDSGGPMVTHEDPSNPGKSVLVGIVSRGKGCGQTGQTAIYTRVSAFYNWIVDTIKADKEKYWKCTDETS